MGGHSAALPGKRRVPPGCPRPEPFPAAAGALTCPWRAGSCPPRCGWRGRCAGPWRAGSGAERSRAEPNGAERGLEPAAPSTAPMCGPAPAAANHRAGVGKGAWPMANPRLPLGDAVGSVPGGVACAEWAGPSSQPCRGPAGSPRCVPSVPSVPLSPRHCPPGSDQTHPRSEPRGLQHRPRCSAPQTSEVLSIFN